MLTAKLPRRCQCTAGHRLPPDTRVVSRPARWSSPWVVRRGDDGWLVQDARNSRSVRCGSEADAREFAVMCFSDWIAPRAALVRAELRGWHLACRCPPGWPCHADVLLEIANAP